MMVATRPLRFGLVGASSFAEERLLPAVQASAQVILWSIVSRDQARARALAIKFGARAPDTSPTGLDQMLVDTDLDAVLIANQDGCHAETAIAAAKAGKHVLVEKPLALTLEDAHAIDATCRAHAVRCMVGYHQRCVPAHQRLREALSHGVIGDVQRLQLTWSYIDPFPMGWRTKPSLGRWWVLAALGTHVIDLAEWLLSPTCGAIQDVSATTTDRLYHQGADESASIHLCFENGARAVLEVSCVDASRKQIEIVGTKGTILCRNTLGAGGTGDVSVNGERLEFEPANPYLRELERFAEAIRSGQDFSPNATDGIRNLRWIEMAHQSSLTTR